MSASFFIAKRYLLAKRKGLFSMITTVIGVAGVTLAVAALIITLAVMNGFQSDIKQKVIDAQAHVTIYGRFDGEELHQLRDKIAEDRKTEATAPFVLGQAILTSHGRTAGVAVKGLSARLEKGINSLDKSLTHGTWDNFNEIKEGEPASIVLGEELADACVALLLVGIADDVTVPVHPGEHQVYVVVVGVIVTCHDELSVPDYCGCRHFHALLCSDEPSGRRDERTDDEFWKEQGQNDYCR